MYSALPFAFAQVVIELPYIFSKMMIYCSIFYSMATSQWTFLNFVCYLFFMHFTVMCFMFYGMMTTAVTSNHNVASTIAAHFYMLWNLFSGFMIPYKRIPIWWRWYYWANPMARLLCLSGCSFIFRHDFLGVIAITVFGFCILFAIIFAVAVKSFNSRKR